MFKKLRQSYYPLFAFTVLGNTEFLIINFCPIEKPWTFISEILRTRQYLFLDWLFYLISDYTHYFIEMTEEGFKMGHDPLLLCPTEFFRTFT